MSVAAVASAAGKVILLGEHAVVYGRPAIAVPLSDLRATVLVEPLASKAANEHRADVLIVAEDLAQEFWLSGVYDSDVAVALQASVRNTLAHLGQGEQPLKITIRSQIPIARGLGSGTAVSTAIVRALAQHYRETLSARDVSELAYRTEVILHGSPSGVDNTVAAYERPIYFVRGGELRALEVARAFTLLIGDTGVPSRTKDAVAAVREGWQADDLRYNTLFDRIGAVVNTAKAAIARGDLMTLGMAMSEGHAALQDLGVSSEDLDRLVKAALDGGALGAKLSGGGRGGCMVALVPEEVQERVRTALLAAGAERVMSTVICSSG